jgi:hypothetical protein
VFPLASQAYRKSLKMDLAAGTHWIFPQPLRPCHKVKIPRCPRTGKDKELHLDQEDDARVIDCMSYDWRKQEP